MTISRVTAAWFSPTDGTRLSVLEIARTLAAPAEPQCHDLTVAGFVPPPVQLGEHDILVIGIPVYRGRVPQQALERLADWQGQQTRCVLVATYGNRHYDDALVELSDFFTARGFVPVAAAALVARHTYGEIQQHRPDAKDLTQDRDFATRIEQLLEGPPIPVEVPGSRPYTAGTPNLFRPRFDHDRCTLCELCSVECTTGAISQDEFCTLDQAICIGCLRCVRLCPEDAILMDDPQYLEFAAGLTSRLATPRANEYWPG